MAATFTAKQVARDVSAAIGRQVDAKRVRAWVRANVAAFDDDGYTAHLYDARQRKAIVDGMTAAAAKGRAKAAAEARTEPDKA